MTYNVFAGTLSLTQSINQSVSVPGVIVLLSYLCAISDHPPSGVVHVYNFGCVCLCVCQMITFESLNVGSSYMHIRYISTEYKSSAYMKVIASRLRSREQKD